MTEIDETTWRQQTFGTGKQTAVPGILAMANAPTWGELEEERAAKAAAEATAARREKIAALDAANDHPIAKRSALMAEAGESRIRIADLAEQLARAQQDHERIEANLAYYDRVVGEIQAAAAPPPSDDPLAVAGRRAHAEFVEATRAAFAAVQAGTPRRERRPFAGGVAVRSHLECVHCQRENVDPETSALLHLDPERPVPITTAADEAQLAAAGHRDQAERRAYGDYGLAVR